VKSPNLIVFDMDGIIIDVSMSYRDTVRQTARLFLRKAPSWQTLPNPLFPLSDLARVKQTGGLNNDWDLSFLVISLLFSLVKISQAHKDNDIWSRYEKTICQCDVTELARFLNSEARPLSTLLEKKGKLRDEFIASLYAGDVGSGNIIKQIFQEIYLGEDLFQSTYGIHAKVYHGEGYIKRELPLIDRSILEALSKSNFLAIATGRPKLEAEYSLERFGLRKYFRTILTLDDCIREEKRLLAQEGRKVSLSKPNPYMLDAIAAALGHESSTFYYIGDMPDDMEAAARSKAGFVAVGSLFSAPEMDTLRKELLRAGADHVIQDFKQIENILQ
jgi:phosphoglycolate phosphatase-like HAD superfamily hydrolase